MAQSNVYKHYLRILDLWPKDLLRPNVSFQKTVRSRIDTTFGVKKMEVESNEVLATPPKPADDAAEMKQVNALYSLLDNRYSKQFPLSDKFMQPRSHPTYYADLMAELDAAPTRSWFGTQLNKWKGFLRLS